MIRPNKKGFLLFEVMMSIVIITAGLLFITRSYSFSKDSIRRSIDVFRTTLLLEEKMWELEEAGEAAAEKSSGEFKEPEGYEWEIEAENLDDDAFVDSKLNVVTVRVFEERNRKKTMYSVWTYLRDKF